MNQKASTPLADLMNDARAAEIRGDWITASEKYREAVSLAPLDAHVCYRAGNSLLEAGDAEGSLQYLEKATMLSPGTIEFDLKLGEIFFSLRRFGEAIDTYKQVLANDPNNVSASNNIGICLQEAGEIDDAISAMQYSLRIAPDDPIVHANFGSALLKAGRADEALEHLIEATSKNVKHAEAWSNLGVAFQETLKLDEALDAHRTALALAPNNSSIRYNLSMTLLLLGEYIDGFEVFEHRRHMPDRKPRSFDIPEWFGESLVGKSVLVHAEQGAGDTIMFARFLTRLTDSGAHITFSVQQSLESLEFRFAKSVDVKSGKIEPTDFDYQIPLLSLPNRFDITLQDIGNSEPYIAPPQAFQNTKSDVPRIGLVWAGNPNHTNDLNRSIPFAKLAPLLALPQIQWVSLQVGERAADIAKSNSSIEDLSAGLQNFSDTAAAIANLDLVVTVDTSVAHLAGAMGAKVWILLPYAPDWRWLLNRQDTPWYPQARLFRQTEPKAWDSVIMQVSAAIAQKEYAI